MFQIGDYVEVDFTKFYDIPPGLTTDKLGGEVICGGSEYGRIGIQFFENIGGHSCGGKGKFGHCYWFDAGSVFFDMPENIFIESIRTDVYMKNKRYYYTDNHKEITDKCVLFKIIKELTMKGVEIY